MGTDLSGSPSFTTTWWHHKIYFFAKYNSEVTEDITMTMLWWPGQPRSQPQPLSFRWTCSYCFRPGTTLFYKNKSAPTCQRDVCPGGRGSSCASRRRHIGLWLGGSTPRRTSSSLLSLSLSLLLGVSTPENIIIVDMVTMMAYQHIPQSRYMTSWYVLTCSV